LLLLLFPERVRWTGCGLPLREEREACRGTGWIKAGLEGEDLEEEVEEARARVVIAGPGPAVKEASVWWLTLGSCGCCSC